MGDAVLLSRSTAIGANGRGRHAHRHDPFLIRGMMAGGNMQDWFEPRTYHILEARLGVDADACTPTRRPGRGRAPARADVPRSVSGAAPAGPHETRRIAARAWRGLPPAASGDRRCSASCV
jgi:hypothetical protein